MLQAKDQGHKRKCSPKKKGLHKNFSGDLQKKKVFTKIFQAISTKKRFIFQVLHNILTIQKIVLFSSRGQANFRGLEASRPRTSKCVLKDVLEAKDVLEDSTSGGQAQDIEDNDKVSKLYISCCSNKCMPAEASFRKVDLLSQIKGKH